jgi:uncharacterized zinc-type alcohol dehydrogenase-like protein
MLETKESPVADVVETRLPSKSYAAMAASEDLVPWDFTRRKPRPHDVLLEIKYCGICHTDIHFIRNDFGMSTYPLVPGHEMVGIVTEVGDHVTKFKVGDTVGVGCMVDSCRECDNCKQDLEQYCLGGVSFSYGSPERHGDGTTYGGYSNQIVCDENFVLKVDKKLPLDKAAPLLCAGITTYSPLRNWKVGKGAESSYSWFRWPRAYGSKICCCFWCRSNSAQHFSIQKRRCIEIGCSQICSDKR